MGGHYADEFAESHGKELVVRQAIGAALPAAGVGCAIAREALDALAAERGAPFDAASLTEDYELGLRLAELGRRTHFARVRAGPGRPVIAVRSHFPAAFGAAVRQKARWVSGIALMGWDRLGWRGGIAERWMRLRDRQSLLAAALFFAGYSSLIFWAAAESIAALSDTRLRPLPDALQAIILVNIGLFAWRIVMRAAFVTAAYDWRQGLLSLPRMLMGNAIAICAACRAVTLYLSIRRTGRTEWHKTTHVFPRELPAE